MKHLLAAGLICLLLLVAGCDAIEKYLLKPEEKPAPVVQEPEPPWQPDKSRPALLKGYVVDKDTGAGISGVSIEAEYTMPCTGTSCDPYYEHLSTTTDASGSFALELYEHFWDVSVHKIGFNFVNQHFSVDEIKKNASVTFDLAKAERKSFTGFVRDQGSRMIIDRGANKYTVNIEGRAQQFDYFLVENDNDSAIYQKLLRYNNKQIDYDAYFFVAPNNVGVVEVINFVGK